MPEISKGVGLLKFWAFSITIVKGVRREIIKKGEISKRVTSKTKLGGGKFGSFKSVDMRPC